MWWVFLQLWWCQGSYCDNAAVIKHKENGMMKRERATCLTAKSRMKEAKWGRRCFPNENKSAIQENWAARKGFDSLNPACVVWKIQQVKSSTSNQVAILLHMDYMQLDTYTSHILCMVCSILKPQNCIPASCGQSVGFICPWPPERTRALCSRVWGKRIENVNKCCVSLAEISGLLSTKWEWRSLSVSGVVRE